MTKEIERVGIPVVQIAAVVDIATSVGVSRILRGFAITCPVGNPVIGTPEDEKISRRRYMEKALAMLEAPGDKNRIADVR